MAIICLPLLKVQVEMNKYEVIQPLMLQPVPFLQMDTFKHVPTPLTSGDTTSLT